MCDGWPAGPAPLGMLSRCSRTSERNHLAGRVRLGAELGPRLHQPAPLLEQITAPIRGLDRVWDGVRQRHLGDLVRERRAIRRPVSERAAQAMNGDIVARELLDQLAQRVGADRLPWLEAGEDVSA